MDEVQTVSEPEKFLSNQSKLAYVGAIEEERSQTFGPLLLEKNRIWRQERNISNIHTEN
jgi:hypothetical protein